jgi:carboxymethylenebutenolidase
MTTKTNNNTDNFTIPQEAFDWYDEYAHGMIDRRTFMKRLASLAVVGMSTNILASALLPNYAQAEQVSFNDQDITASYETFESPLGLGSVQGYFVKPANLSGTAPAVLVVHENRGLNPYIKDVARRAAKAGFIAFAPDILHTLGGYPGNDDEGRTMQRTLDRAKVEQDFIASAKYLKEHPLCNGKLGGVGFCFGGYIINMLAARAPEVINAGVPFYGTPAAKELRKNIKSPLMIQLGELDKRVNATWDEYEQDLKANNVDYVMHMYEQANHGFHNDSTSRYVKKSADLAWERTIAFFNKHLSTQK